MASQRAVMRAVRLASRRSPTTPRLTRSASSFQSTSSHTTSDPPLSSRPPYTAHSDSSSRVPLPLPVAKPPSATWYTASPSYAALDRSVDDLLHRTRHALYHAGVLKRYAASPDFKGTGIRLRYLRWKARGVGEGLEGEGGDPYLKALFSDVIWKNAEGFRLEFSDGKTLKLSTHRKLTARLSELRQLSRYVHFALTLGSGPHGGDTAEMRGVQKEIEEMVEKYQRRRGAEREVKGTEAKRDEFGRYYGVGRKKSASATAWLIETNPPSAASSEVEAKSEETTAVSATGEGSVPPVGQVRINGRPLSEYFVDPQRRAVVLQPFMISRTIGLYNVHLLTHGSGPSSQSHACAMALSRALLSALGDRSNFALGVEDRYGRKNLEKSGLAMRDPRVVERKKTGMKGAKARYTWVKR